MEKKIVSSEEAAQYLDRPVGTLANWRSKGIGPRFVKLDRRVGYRLCDLEKFVESRIIEPELVSV